MLSLSVARANRWMAEELGPLLCSFLSYTSVFQSVNPPLVPATVRHRINGKVTLGPHVVRESALSIRLASKFSVTLTSGILQNYILIPHLLKPRTIHSNSYYDTNNTTQHQRCESSTILMN
jgi:hypothetical protein